MPKAYSISALRANLYRLLDGTANRHRRESPRPLGSFRPLLNELDRHRSLGVETLADPMILRMGAAEYFAGHGVGAMLAAEGLAVGGIGVAAGLALGWLISLILIHVINRQSFHWSMDMHLPLPALLGLAATLVAAATLTAVVSGRRAMSTDVTQAVREDW